MTGQSAFTDAVMNPARPVPEGIIRPDGIKASKRFDVYRNNVISSLIDALGASYPMVKTRVGAEFFNAMASIYVRRYPPTSPLMILYGTQFSSFLDEFEPAAKLPWLSDLARLERARREAYHAADAEPNGMATLAGLGAEDMMHAKAVLLPSVRIIRSTYPIFSIWSALNYGQEIPSSGDAEDVLVARPEMVVEMHLLPAGNADFLCEIQGGSSLGEAIEHAGKTPNFDLSRAIGGLFEARLLESATQKETS